MVVMGLAPLSPGVSGRSVLGPSSHFSPPFSALVPSSPHNIKDTHAGLLRVLQVIGVLYLLAGCRKGLNGEDTTMFI